MIWEIYYTTLYISVIIDIHKEKIDHGNTYLIAIDHDFASRHGFIIGQNDHFIVLAGIGLDYGAAAHPQKLVTLDDRTAQHDRDSRL